MNSLTGLQVQELFKRLDWPFRFSETELAGYNTIPIVDCPANCLAFPTPEQNEGLNVLNLRHLSGTDPAKQPSFFDHPWYLEEPFAQKNCPTGWHFISTDVLSSSISQPSDYLDSADGFVNMLEAGNIQGSGAPPTEFSLNSSEIPVVRRAMAVELTLMLFLQYKLTGEQLLGRKHTWCSDITTLNRVVTAGAFGRNGLFISSHPNNYYSRGLGVCPKWL